MDATDEAMLVERLGLPVHVVEGDPRNVKITTAEDLAAAQIALQIESMMRIGTGYDLHTPGRGPPVDPGRRDDRFRSWGSTVTRTPTSSVMP